MDIIFCDIDGVLRTNSSDLEWSLREGEAIPNRVYDRKFNPKAVSNLNYIHNLLRVKIVVSSTWRTQFSLSELQSIFRKNGVSAPIIDVTPKLNNRGEEIQTWLDINSPKKYVVIDDNIKDIKNYISSNNIIRCDAEVGFEDLRLVDRAIDILA